MDCMAIGRASLLTPRPRTFFPQPCGRSPTSSPEEDEECETREREKVEIRLDGDLGGLCVEFGGRRPQSPAAQAATATPLTGIVLR